MNDKTVIKIGANRQVREMIFELCEIMELERPEDRDGVLVLSVSMNMIKLGMTMLKKVNKKELKKIRPVLEAIGFKAKK